MKWAALALMSLGLAACEPHNQELAPASQGRVRAAPRKDLPAFPTVAPVELPMAPTPAMPNAPAFVLPSAPIVDQSGQQ